MGAAGSQNPSGDWLQCCVLPASGTTDGRSISTSHSMACCGQPCCGCNDPRYETHVAIRGPSEGADKVFNKNASQHFEAGEHERTNQGLRILTRDEEFRRSGEPQNHSFNSARGQSSHSLIGLISSAQDDHSRDSNETGAHSKPATPRMSNRCLGKPRISSIQDMADLLKGSNVGDRYRNRSVIHDQDSYLLDGWSEDEQRVVQEVLHRFPGTRQEDMHQRKVGTPTTKPTPSCTRAAPRAFSLRASEPSVCARRRRGADGLPPAGRSRAAARGQEHRGLPGLLRPPPA